MLKLVKPIHRQSGKPRDKSGKGMAANAAAPLRKSPVGRSRRVAMACAAAAVALGAIGGNLASVETSSGSYGFTPVPASSASRTRSGALQREGLGGADVASKPHWFENGIPGGSAVGRHACRSASFYDRAAGGDLLASCFG